MCEGSKVSFYLEEKGKKCYVTDEAKEKRYFMSYCALKEPPKASDPVVEETRAPGDDKDFDIDFESEFNTDAWRE